MSNSCFRGTQVSSTESTGITINLNRIEGINPPISINPEVRVSRLLTQAGGSIYIASRIAPSIARNFAGVDETIRSKSDKAFFNMASLLADSDPSEPLSRSWLARMSGKFEYWNGTTVAYKEVGNNALRLYCSLLSPARTGLSHELLLRTGVCTKNSQKRCLAGLGMNFNAGDK